MGVFGYSDESNLVSAEAETNRHGQMTACMVTDVTSKEIQIKNYSNYEGDYMGLTKEEESIGMPNGNIHYYLNWHDTIYVIAI